MSLDPSLNNTLLVLIPKVQNSERITQFRPISLFSVVYKILTKTLVQRLRPLMSKVVSLHQFSFIPGCDISDNIVVAQEVIHSLKHFSGSKRGMVLKIGLEKAYDRISWDFLRDTLVLVGFSSMIVNVIMNCVSLTSY